MSGWIPTTPSGQSVGFGAHDPTFERLEAVGKEALPNVAFVLIAGGRGERLGYDGIKVRRGYMSASTARSLLPWASKPKLVFVLNDSVLHPGV